MSLETVANIATVVLAVVAIIFAVNNYMLFALWWSIGHLKKTWPIESKITFVQISVRGTQDDKPSAVEIRMRATVRPYPFAWNPRRPIQIHEASILFRDLKMPVEQLVRIDQAIERETITAMFSANVNPRKLTASDQADLLKGGELTLEIITTQAPRSKRSVRTSIEPSRINTADGVDIDLHTLIANLESDAKK